MEKSTIDQYFKDNDDDNVSHCYSTTSAENNDYVVYAGEGSWGGDGIIYVIKKSDNRLLWFLFSDRSNPFAKVQIKNNIIVAFSTLNKCWTIPIQSPEKLTIET